MDTPAPVSREKLLIALLLAVAFLLRFVSLGNQSFWLDEIYSVNVGSVPNLSALLSKQLEDTTPPLYYLVLHFWTLLFGTGELASRFPSLLFNVATCGGVYGFGRRYLDQRTALVAAVLFAVSPNQVYYSQEARAYSLLTFLSFAAVLTYCSALRKNDWARWIGFGGVTVLMLYTHLYGIFLAAGFWMFQVVVGKRWPETSRRFFWSQFAALALFSPWLATVAKYLGRNAVWIQEPWMGSLLQSAGFFCCTGWRMAATDAGNRLVFVGSVLFVGLLAIALIEAVRRPNRAVTLLWFSGLVPFLLSFGVSLEKPIFLPGRYDVQYFPPLVLLAAYGLTRFRKIPSLLVLLFFMSVNGYFLKQYFIEYKKSSDRQVSEILRKETKPGDTLVFTNLTRVAANYYFPSQTQNRIAFPVGRPGLQPQKALENDGAFAVSEIRHLLERLRLKKPENLWVVFNLSPAMNLSLVEELGRDFRLAEVIRVAPGRNDNQPEILYRFTVDTVPVRTADWPEEEISLRLDCGAHPLCVSHLTNRSPFLKTVEVRVYQVDRYLDYTDFDPEGSWKMSLKWNPHPPPRFSSATALVAAVSEGQPSPMLRGRVSVEKGKVGVWLHTFAEDEPVPGVSSRAGFEITVTDSAPFIGEPTLRRPPADWVFFPVGVMNRPEPGEVPVTLEVRHRGNRPEEYFDFRGLILNRVDNTREGLEGRWAIAKLRPHSFYEQVIPWKEEKFLILVLTNRVNGRRFDFVLPPLADLPR